MIILEKWNPTFAFAKMSIFHFIFTFIFQHRFKLRSSTHQIQTTIASSPSPLYHRLSALASLPSLWCYHHKLNVNTRPPPGMTNDEWHVITTSNKNLQRRWTTTMHFHNCHHTQPPNYYHNRHHNHYHNQLPQPPSRPLPQLPSQHVQSCPPPPTTAAMMRKMGPNNARHIVCANSTCFFNIFCLFLYNQWSLLYLGSVHQKSS